MANHFCPKGINFTACDACVWRMFIVLAVYVYFCQVNIPEATAKASHTSTTRSPFSRAPLRCRHSFACPTHLFSYFIFVFFFFCWSFLKEFYYWNSPWLSYTHSNAPTAAAAAHSQQPSTKMEILLNIAWWKARWQCLLTEFSIPMYRCYSTCSKSILIWCYMLESHSISSIELDSAILCDFWARRLCT